MCVFASLVAAPLPISPPPHPLLSILPTSFSLLPPLPPFPHLSSPFISPRASPPVSQSPSQSLSSSSCLYLGFSVILLSLALIFRIVPPSKIHVP